MSRIVPSVHHHQHRRNASTSREINSCSHCIDNHCYRQENEILSRIMCSEGVFALAWHQAKHITVKCLSSPDGRVLSQPLVSQIMEQNAGLCLGQPVDITQRPLLLPSNHYLALHILCINSHTAYSKSSGDKMQSHNGCILMTWLQ